MNREEIRKIAEMEFPKMCYELFQCDEESCLGFNFCPYTREDEDEEVVSQSVIINIGEINIHF